MLATLAIIAGGTVGGIIGRGNKTKAGKALAVGIGLISGLAVHDSACNNVGIYNEADQWTDARVARPVWRTINDGTREIGFSLPRELTGLS